MSGVMLNTSTCRSCETPVPDNHNHPGLCCNCFDLSFCTEETLAAENIKRLKRGLKPIGMPKREES
jgi:hypothetical protein